jgi:hypothetical protein
MSVTWFSALLRVVVVIGERPERFERSVVVFGADGWESAERRALELGHASEESFESADGDPVFPRLVAVETLDMLGERIDDGRAIHSESARIVGEFDLERLAPERSTPGQSGV